MNNLCFLSNLTSNEWAAWVQALGSIVAIIAAFLISGAQNKNAIKLHQREQLTAQTDIAKTLLVLAKNSAMAMKYTTEQLSNRESIFRAAEGLIPSNIGELQRINTYLSALPLLSVPNSLVTPTMSLGSTVRQFYEKVEMALRLYQKLDTDMYADLFKVMGEMNKSVELSCQQIADEVDLLEQQLV